MRASHSSVVVLFLFSIVSCGRVETTKHPLPNPFSSDLEVEEPESSDDLEELEPDYCAISDDEWIDINQYLVEDEECYHLERSKIAHDMKCYSLPGPQGGEPIPFGDSARWRTRDQTCAYLKDVLF